MGRGLPGRLFAKPRDHRKTEYRIADEHPGCGIEQIPEASESDHGSEELRHVCPAVREVTHQEQVRMGRRQASAFPHGMATRITRGVP